MTAYGQAGRQEKLLECDRSNLRCVREAVMQGVPLLVKNGENGTIELDDPTGQRRIYVEVTIEHGERPDPAKQQAFEERLDGGDFLDR